LGDVAKSINYGNKWPAVILFGKIFFSIFSERAAERYTHLPRTEIKKFLDRHVIASEDQLVERIQEFVNQVHLDQKGVFVCDFVGWVTSSAYVPNWSEKPVYFPIKHAQLNASVGRSNETSV
jgi:hypothetical protein